MWQLSVIHWLWIDPDRSRKCLSLELSCTPPHVLLISVLEVMESTFFLKLNGSTSKMLDCKRKQKLCTQLFYLTTLQLAFVFPFIKFGQSGIYLKPVNHQTFLAAFGFFGITNFTSRIILHVTDMKDIHYCEDATSIEIIFLDSVYIMYLLKSASESTYHQLRIIYPHIFYF